jgi:hypothetical protein
MDAIIFHSGTRPPLLTNREAAALLRVSEHRLWLLTRPRGPIAAVWHGRSVRYAPDVLQHYLEQYRVGVIASAA